MSKKNLAEWKKAKRHEVTLLSGTTVSIEVPNLPKMIQGGDVPNALIEAAIGTSQGDTPDITVETIKSNYEFYKFLIASTVVEPELTTDDVDDIPSEDQEMLVEFATRTRDIDAVGHQLGGLETQKSFREFRLIDRGDAGSSNV